MTVVALLSVAPVVEGSMAGEVAKAVAALDDFDVEYETNPMGTVIEADSVEELMAAATAAHEAVDGDRVSTVLKIDDKRTSDSPASEKVEAVERELGRPARSGGGDGGTDGG
ncbi:thiamine-binding protein [Halorarum salinum]|uniref:Thiamine-binding protein n=1 Tax=Halorarum salinum TaxID=2743089 RepID=A0A7D5QIY1_9EURY|nr:thiamine-binding protein [Halobaculum salinum]QLG63364.1 thiamine-binding protein [Halobaculum salinum]